MESAFGSDLTALVTSGGVPVAGVTVFFVAPASGASGTFSDMFNATIADTNASGVANAGKFTANGAVGSYQVTATIADGSSTQLRV